MKRSILKLTVVATFLAGAVASCSKKLDLFPTNDITAEVVYSTPQGYKQSLAKVYGAFALTGNGGPGSGDIAGIDAGTSDFFRLYWKAQELSTDEAVVAWGDPGIQDFHNMNWTAANPMLTGLYYRSTYQITLCNEFIRQSAPGKVAERGISGADATNIAGYAVEARFLRAYQYWILMDLFGNPPFITEADVIGAGNPRQIRRAELFTYIENELKAIETLLPAYRTNEYGRVDRGAAQALLARLYLNAGVYTGTNRFTDAITYASRVIAGGYTLIGDYRNLMLADNNLNTSEFIGTINYDGIRTQNFGGTTFLTHAAIGGTMNASDFGVDNGWGGIRTTRRIPDLFPDVTGAADRRSQFFTSGQSIDIANQTTFTDGFAITKYRNRTRSGANGSNPTFVDIDMPLFRLAEMYLIYAESVLRGGTGGDAATALNYVNLLRTRAYGNATGNINSGQLNLDFILDERARELYWEGHRRTDLIRYNRFVEASYLWPWKGGVRDGTAVPAFRRLYPIPANDLQANNNLVQNPGY
ncbi:MAG: RagB/SusD family nutrient uptake outer membrane protein [Bacteroidetes bacterium]|nr:MAG: RagB/SusD family nutrient uptake outer membrane protein [Bacteroidota bacterium]TAE69489.1 MAG: RagB/SusD family nutrient uptake outer membrane protein [Bacteroidota bacterium]TAF98058.1 MAG: RagB/SusD family nutrient uptake outer membrane protein [Bacteroidota bacterium]